MTSLGRRLPGYARVDSAAPGEQAAGQVTGTADGVGARPPQMEPPPPSPVEGRPSRGLSRVWTSTPAYMSAALVFLVLVFTVLRPSAFATSFNATNLFLNAADLLILGVGITYVMVAAGLDLSIGSVLAFSNVTAAQVMIAIGGDGVGLTLVGVLIALACGAGWGVINGVLITKARVPALITTLGTFGAAQGFALLVTGGTDVRSVPLPLIHFGNSKLAGVVPWTVVVAAVTVAIGAWVLHATRFGRHTYLIGSNAEAARRAGIQVDRHLIKLYGLAGLCAGIAAVTSLARFATTTIEGHSLDNLLVITAVILGGTSLYGGVGTVLGTVIGVFIPAILQNGFIIVGIEPFWQQVAIGLVLILAVYIDQLKRRNRERR